MNSDSERIELYTDGACSGNPGPGGWAFILRDATTGREMERSGGERSTTNNRMELLSVIEGLRALKKPSHVTLYSDSRYVVNGLSEWMENWKKKGWRRGSKPLKNLELWQELDRLRNIHDLHPHWVPGHANHPENERCDQLAVQAREQIEPP